MRDQVATLRLNGVAAGALNCHGVGTSELDRFGERILVVLKEAADLRPLVETEPDGTQRASAPEPVLAGEMPE